MKKTLLIILIAFTLTNCNKNQKEDTSSLKAKNDTLEHVSVKENAENLDKKVEKPKQLLFKCKENDNGVSIYDDPLNKTCVCNETTFDKAYEIFYNESPDYLQDYLLKKLPPKNFVAKFDAVETTYSRIMNDTLKIHMFFQGGDNDYVFYKNSDNKIEYKEYLGLP